MDKAKKRKENREIPNQNKRAATESKLEEQMKINALEIKDVLEWNMNKMKLRHEFIT